MNRLFRTTFLACSMSFSMTAIGASSYTFTDLSADSTYAAANAINNAGQIVGFQSVNVPHNSGTSSSFTSTQWEGMTGSEKFLTAPTFELSSVATGINDFGHAVGYSYDRFGNFKATSWENGQTTYLNALHNAPSRLASINSHGQIVGTNNYQPSLWDNKNSSPVALENGYLFVNSINDSGQIAGLGLHHGEVHATIWDGANTIDLGTLGIATYLDLSEATDINNNGVAVGYSMAGGNKLRAFIWEDDTMTALPMIHGYGGLTYANAINDLGQIVGYSVPAGQTYQHATLWNGRTAYDLNDFLDANSKNDGWVLTNALDINDHGWIVGVAENTLTNETHAFLLSSENAIMPIPEPSTYAMLLAGLVMIGFVGQRKTIVSWLKY